MADIIDSKWSENDALNNAAAPDGWQNSYLANTIGPTGQSNMAALKRFYNQINAIYTTTGSANAYVMTFDKPLAGYSKGIQYAFWANHTNTGPATLNISTLGSKAIIRNDGAALTAGQITSGTVVIVFYDGTNFRVQNLTTNPTFSGVISGNGSGLTDLNASAITTGTINNARLPGTMSGKVFTSDLYIDRDTDRTIQFRTSTALTQAIFGSEAATGAAFVNVHAANGGYLKQLKMPRTGNMTWDGQTVWTAGNDGINSGLDAGLLVGRSLDIGANANTVVSRDGNADITTRDGIFGRSANEGYLFFGAAKPVNFGFDGTYIRTSGADFKVNGNIDVTTGVYATGEVMSRAGHVLSQGASNTHYWHRNNSGVNRAVSYYSPAAEQHLVQLYNSAGASVRAYSYAQSDGQFYVNGYIGTNGSVNVGNATLYNDGNIKFAGTMASGYGDYLHTALSNRIVNDGGTKNISITGNAATANASGVASTLRQSGTGAGMTFNWSGQGGQPSWVWGGSDGINHYVYNPANFAVAQANNATNLAGMDSNQWARVAYSQNTNETAFPMGTYLLACNGGSVPRRHDRNLRYSTSEPEVYRADTFGTLLAGTWRACGLIKNSDYVYMFQRVG